MEDVTEQPNDDEGNFMNIEENLNLEEEKKSPDTKNDQISKEVQDT